MVFFVCEACNETLKKNQVDKHCFSCRRCEAVTCVDCQVTFYGDDYKEHMVCVSEAEKYEKSLFKGKKEKADPQAAWMDLIADCAAQTDCSQQVQRILSRISEVGNVPRNKKKFVNFIKNSMKIYADGPIDETWDYLDKAKNAVAPVLPAVGSAKAAAADAAPDSDRVEKKRKLDQFEEANDSVDDEAAVEKKKKKKKNDKKYHSNDETDEAAAVDSSEEKKAKKKKKERAKEEDRVEYDFKADKPAGEEVEKKKKKKKDKNRG